MVAAEVNIILLEEKDREIPIDAEQVWLGDFQEASTNVYKVAEANKALY
jgi:hypothetical protein